MKKNFKPLYTSEEAIALTESLVDQDTKFEREVDALINTEEAKDILLKAYNNADDNGKIALADATEEQFLDKYAPDGSAKDKDEEEKKDEAQNDEDFLEDASGLDNEGNQEVTDDGGSEDDQDENIFDDGGSEDDQDNQDTGIDSDNIFAQATSGDETGELTDNGGDNSDNPFLESKKTTKSHSLNEARKAARSSKANRQKLRRLNEHHESPDEMAEELDNLYYGKIWKYINAKIAKLPKSRDKIMYITKIQSKPEVAKGLAEKLILKLGVDMSSYGAEGVNAFTRVLKQVVGDIYDLQTSEW